MLKDEQSSHIQRAVQFFSDAGLVRLLLSLKQKFIAKSGLVGSITISDSADNEREFLSGILNKHFAKGEAIKIPLATFDDALRKSGFRCSLQELLSAFFPEEPLTTKRELRVQQATRYAHFRSQLEAIVVALPDGSPGRLWLTQGAYGLNWLFIRYKRVVDGDQIQQEQCFAIVRYVVLMDNRNDRRRRIILAAHVMDRSDDCSVCAKRQT
jgi:hypothetical protein